MKNIEIKGLTFFKEQSNEWQFVADGISKQLVGYNSDLMMLKVKFKKGAIGTLHHHIHSQASFVASGKFEIEIDGEKQILSEGDGFFVQPDLIHGAECIEDGMLIDVFNPVREDFLN